ncbi:MAG: hypothetical protein RL272_479 [Candidatus Parcubacteria bacterium]
MDYEFPKGLTLWNSATGSVAVSQHAWERFILRYPVAAGLVAAAAPRSREYFIERLMIGYLRAVPVDFGDEERIRRILKHHGTDCHILKDTSTRLRYVTAKIDHVVITVPIVAKTH